MSNMKECKCTVCSADMMIGKFASPKKAVCESCKAAGAVTPSITQPDPVLPSVTPEVPEGPVTLSVDPVTPQPELHTPFQPAPWDGEPVVKPVEWTGAKLPGAYFVDMPALPYWSSVPTEPKPWGEDTIAMMSGGHLAPDEDDVPRETPQDVPVQEEKKNSMRASRDAKAGDVRPFIPEPFFLRQSMLASYLQCPDKFYDTYENGYNEETVFTKVGTAIHGIMEDFYNLQKAMAPTPVPDHAIVTMFHKWWTTHAPSEWSWYQEWFKKVASYFQRHADKPKPNVIATELEFQIVVKVQMGRKVVEIPCSGTIDRIDRLDEKTIVIRDYKTNIQPFTKDDLENNIQPSFYAMAAHHLKHVLGDFDNVLFTYDMLRLEYEQRTERTIEQIEEFKPWMADIWDKILSGRDRSPQLNKYCAFCGKRSTCTLYDAVVSGKYQPIITEDTDLGKLDQERDQLTLITKVMTKRLDEINDQLKESILSGGGVAVAGNFEYRTVSQSMYSYPADSVFRVLAMNGLSDRIPDIVTIGSTKLKDVIKDNPALADTFESIKVQGYKAPSLTRSKRKGAPIVDAEE